MPQDVSGQLLPRAPGVYRAGELVAWTRAGAAQPGSSAAGPALLLPARRLRSGLSLLPRVLGLRLLPRLLSHIPGPPPMHTQTSYPGHAQQAPLPSFSWPRAEA